MNKYDQESPRGNHSFTVRVCLAREGGGDPEALGRIVQPEPDDQKRCQCDFVLRRRLSDRKPFGEVVQPDTHGDHQCEMSRR